MKKDVLSVDLTGYEQWTFDSNDLILESLGHLDEAEYQRQLTVPENRAPGPD